MFFRPPCINGCIDVHGLFHSKCTSKCLSSPIFVKFCGQSHVAITYKFSKRSDHFESPFWPICGLIICKNHIFIFLSFCAPIEKYSPCNLISRKPSFIRLASNYVFQSNYKQSDYRKKILKSIFLNIFTQRAAKPTKVNTNVLKVKFASIQKKKKSKIA